MHCTEPKQSSCTHFRCRNDEPVQNATQISAEEIQAELTKENIAPVKIESEDDAVKAASAEVVEALTVGAAEQGPIV